MRMMRWQTLVFAVALGAATLAPARASANAKKECAAAYVDAQKLKKDGSLKQAREKLIVCARDECMSAVKKDCLSWLDEVNAAVPSIVIVAKDPSGKETLDVRVTVNGEVVSETLDANGIELDPGTHKLKFEHGEEDPIEQEVILRAGQKNKSIEIQFGKPATDAAAGGDEGGDSSLSFDEQDLQKKNVPTAAYVLAGVGAVALAGTAFFWLSSEGDKKDLEDSGCSPNCDEADVDAIKQKRLFGDIALGVGVVSLGAAAYFFLTPSKEKKPQAESARVDFFMREGGAFASVRGAF